MRYPIRLCVFFCVCMSLGASLATPAGAQDDAAKPQPDRTMDKFWFPPELVLQNAERLGVSDEQLAKIESQFLESRKTLEVRHADLQAATRKLAEEIKDNASEEEVLKQLDEVLDNERRLKRLHMVTLLRIRKHLSTEQLAEIAELKGDFEAQQRELQRDIQGKIGRIQREFQRRAEAAQPPVELRDAMREFEAAMKRGKVQEAKEKLDQILRDFVEDE